MPVPVPVVESAAARRLQSPAHEAGAQRDARLIIDRERATGDSARSFYAALRVLIEQLDTERAEFGPDYQDHGLPFCWEDGRPPHPTRSPAGSSGWPRAELPLIDLHDIRHSYATAGRDAKIDWKALSQRIGHADVAFTMRQYVQSDLETDRQVATALAELIIGGVLASDRVPADDAPTAVITPPDEDPVYKKSDKRGLRLSAEGL